MRTDLNYYLIKNFQGFKCFVTEQYFWFRKTIGEHEKSRMYGPDAYENYAQAVYVSDLYDVFINSTSQEEKDALKYLRYHNPNERPPKNYDKAILTCYEKWASVFFKGRNKLVKKVDMKVLGRVMRKARMDYGLSSTTVANAIGVDRSTINKYENGLRMPTLVNLLKFCRLFRVTIDELISTSLF
jgi:DNA-binding XRE family transcriptional regulator